MAVGSLQGDEAVRQAMMSEHCSKTAIRLAGGDGEQPALRGQRIEQIGDAFVERLAQAARGAQVEKQLL